MKWHKFETNFWDSETATTIEEKFGAKGILIYLRMMTRIALEIQHADDVIFAHEKGWTKSIEDWARVCKVRTDSWRRVAEELHTLGKVTISLVSTSKPIRINIKFKNLTEFIDLRALSSKSRIPSHHDSGSQLGTHVGPSDKIREDKKNPGSQIGTQEKESSAKKESVNTEKLVQLWNSISNQNKIKGFYSKRTDLIASVLSEHPNFDYWSEVFRKTEASDFLRNSAKKWKTTLEWVLQNHMPISEGKYDDSIQTQKRDPRIVELPRRDVSTST